MQTNRQVFSVFQDFISSFSNSSQVEYVESESKEGNIRRMVDLKNFKEAEVVGFEECN
jgi:hypothetical protein